MSSLVKPLSDVEVQIEKAGLTHLFDSRGRGSVDCPQCAMPKGLRLSLSHDLVRCAGCGLEGPLRAYIWARMQSEPLAGDALDSYSVIDFTTRHERSPTRWRDTLKAEQTEQRGRAYRSPSAPLADRAPTIHQTRSGKVSQVRGPGEVWIISVLSFLFLAAGLAAALLSGFANYSAFRGLVSDPLQAQIWGWSGVIASVITFGGFTFFWWHVSARRRGEAVRAFLFAMAGAATSLAGTTLYMQQNASAAQQAASRALEIKQLRQAELVQAERQLAGIAPSVRSVSGLQAYLSGVEAVGRTHHKAYRDAQNELGLARRRAALEAEIKALRQALQQAAYTHAPPGELPFPAWGFALMLELFASQGTSMACVALLILFSRKRTLPDGDNPSGVEHAFRV